jgi:hypothetical protein
MEKKEIKCKFHEGFDMKFDEVMFLFDQGNNSEFVKALSQFSEADLREFRAQAESRHSNVLVALCKKVQSTPKKSQVSVRSALQFPAMVRDEVR